MCIGLPAGLEELPSSDLLVDNAIFCTGLISGLQKAGRYKSCYSHFGNCLCLKRLETRTKECNMYARLYLEVQWKQRVARMLEGRSTRRSPATFNQPRIVGSTQCINVGPERWWTMPGQVEAGSMSAGWILENQAKGYGGVASARTHIRSRSPRWTASGR